MMVRIRWLGMPHVRLRLRNCHRIPILQRRLRIGRNDPSRESRCHQHCSKRARASHPRCPDQSDSRSWTILLPAAAAINRLPFAERADRMTWMFRLERRNQRTGIRERVPMPRFEGHPAILPGTRFPSAAARATRMRRFPLSRHSRRHRVGRRRTASSMRRHSSTMMVSKNACKAVSLAMVASSPRTGHQGCPRCRIRRQRSCARAVRWSHRSQAPMPGS